MARMANSVCDFFFYAEMHELRDFLSQSYEKSFRFLQTLCGKDAVRMQIFKFFNLKSFISNYSAIAHVGIIRT